MATEFKWKAPGESLQTALSTELNALANSTSSTTGFGGPSGEIANETDLYQFINLEVTLATQGSARSSGAYVDIWIDYAMDGSTYSDNCDTSFTVKQLAAIQFDAATTARRLAVTNVLIAPLDFKLYLRNATGQALAASGNLLKYRRHNGQGV